MGQVNLDNLVAPNTLTNIDYTGMQLTFALENDSANQNNATCNLDENNPLSSIVFDSDEKPFTKAKAMSNKERCALYRKKKKGKMLNEIKEVEDLLKKNTKLKIQEKYLAKLVSVYKKKFKTIMGKNLKA